MTARARQRWSIQAAAVLLLSFPLADLVEAAPFPGPPLRIRKAAGTISVDGSLSDPGWQGADSVTTWFETRVGDNVPPQVHNVAFLTYDDKYFYAGFLFDDPNPAGVRAPLGDHDAISSAIDYAGVIIDSRHDGKSAQMFLADPRGLQYDALTNDVTGEDSSPDYFWDAQGKITATGWTLEIRIPFSSLRYEDEPNPEWGVLLYRNYPRDRRYQFFSARLPRDVNCFICNSSKLTGLTNLPSGAHLVVAPFGSAAQQGAPRSDLGSPMTFENVEFDGGADLKWNPSAGLAIDATVNPDFSQIESDVAQIAANERFALFFPEKRPFFLEGVDLLSTQINATYTRTITSPVVGLRATGRTGSTAYTVLATQDEGGGLVILPGPQGSDFAPQDFHSNVGVFRVRHDLGSNYVSLLGNVREVLGGGFNHVLGPDFNWRPNGKESLRGQILFSESRTPNLPTLASQWDGRYLSDHAAQVDWLHTARTVDWYLQALDIGEDFRADNGFLPQVGYREGYAEVGYTLRPQKSFISRQRIFTVNWVDFEIPNNDRILTQRNSIGTGIDGKLSSFIRVELNRDAFRVGDQLLRRFRPRFYVESSPARVLNFVSAEAFVGEEVDFANAREAHGVTLNGTISVRPSDHLEVRGNVSRRWIDVDTGSLEGRLFTAQVERMRANYSFNSRAFLRLIGQYVQTLREPTLYTFAVAPKEAKLSGSALFAYKLNWQTVLYLGFGGDNTFEEVSGNLDPSGRQWFTKVSYAWQR